MEEPVSLSEAGGDTTGEIDWIDFEKGDIMRHGLVKKIVAVYERADRKRGAAREEKE